MAEKRPNSRSLFKGRVRALRAKGYEIDKRGRARKNGKPVRAETVAKAAQRIDLAKKRVLAKSKLLPNLERVTPKDVLEDFSVENAAKWTGKSRRTIEKYIRIGGAPREDVDTIRAHLQNEEAYASEWQHGTKKTWSREDKKELSRALRMFVQGKRKRAKNIQERYQAWERVKKKLRQKLTKKAWKELMKKVGRSAALRPEGSFSVIRFVLS